MRAGEDDREAGPLAQGSTVGRYVILGKVGGGGMGVVYAAHDPELDRKVALKLVKPGDVGSDRTAGRARLLREAQAMARLVHANVIAVHDVGVAGDEVFLAMDFVAGGTLKAWMRERRGWREVVAMFVKAGRGLAAAHAAGLVHRDFKPDNVLCGEGGSVRVTDFGLARVAAEPGPDSAGPSPSPSALGTALTRTGSVFGTPAYMSPEQHAGAVAGPASDQFSFAVALYEGLYGERPFAPRPADAALPASLALAAEVTRGVVRDAPRGAAVPARVRRLVVRALAVDPGQRWPSMDQLLDALDRLRRPPRWPWVAGGVAVIAGVVLATGVAARRPAPCAGLEGRLAGVWDAKVSDQVHQSFTRTGRFDAEATFGRVAPRLDAYARDFDAMRADACAATHVRGEQSPALLDLRMSCLDRRAGALAALTSVLAAADSDVLDHAVQAVAALPALAGCADAAALGASFPPPPAPLAGWTATVAAHLDHATALFDAGKFKEALALSRTVADEARALGYPPLAAQALLLLGTMMEKAGSPPDAVPVLYEAGRQAALAHDDTATARVQYELVYDLGHDQDKRDVALTLAQVAEASASRSAKGDLALADLLDAEGLILTDGGKLADAEASLRRSLAIQERVLGPRALPLASTLNNLADVDRQLARFDEARAGYSRALAITTENLGEGHPNAAAILGNLGLNEQDAGDYDVAADDLGRALALKEKIYGPDHPKVAITLNAIGINEEDLGHLDAARVAYERALAIREKALGPDSALVAQVLGNLAILDRKQHRLDLARAHAERALAIKEKTLGADHPGVANSLDTLGTIGLEDGHLDEARAEFTRAVAIRQKALGPDHPMVAEAMMGIGRVELAQKHTVDACATFTAALVVARKQLAADHPRLVPLLVFHGQCLNAVNKPDLAIPDLEQAIVIATAKKMPELDEATIALARARRESAGLSAQPPAPGGR